MDLETFNAQWVGRPGASEKVRIIGARGYFLDEGKEGKNDLGISDDAFFRCILDQVVMFRGSTDPGQWYLQHPMNPNGCAQLTPGVWWFRIGDHKGHRALVQDEPFAVNRLDVAGNIKTVESGWFGLNMHSEGAEYLVGKWSAGCQVIQSPEGPWEKTWLKFFTPIEDFGQQRVPYLLTESLKATPA